jgi:hypothetical protein
MEPESSLPQHKCPPPVPILTKSHVYFSFLRLHHSISPGLRLMILLFRNRIRFLLWGVVTTSPNPQVGGTSLVGCLLLPIQYIRSYPPYCRPFLHPQPEDTTCRSDRDRLITDMIYNKSLLYSATCACRTLRHSELCKLRTEFKSAILHKRSGCVRGSWLSQRCKMKWPFF